VPSRDLADQRFYIHLRPARIELIDDAANVPVNRFTGGDGQLVGGLVSLNESGRAATATSQGL